MDLNKSVHEVFFTKFYAKQNLTRENLLGGA